MAVLADRLTVFEEAFDKVAAAATKKKPSGYAMYYASEDDTRASKLHDSELRNAINAVQRRLRKADAKEPKTSAKNFCELLNEDASTVKCTHTTPRRSPAEDLAAERG